MLLDYIADFGWTVHPHPPYNLNLAHSNFQLLELMKNGLQRQDFPGHNAVIAVKKWVAFVHSDFYKQSMQDVSHHWQNALAMVVSR